MIFRQISGNQSVNGSGYNRSSKPKNGNLNVDYKPESTSDKEDFKGGDYVDYEEVENE